MRRIVLFIMVLFVSKQLQAQGCSDAGFCTIGNLKPTASNKKDKQKITLGLTNGIGDENVYVFTPSLQYDYKVNNQWALQAKLTANYASGNLGSVFGLGDFFIGGTFAPASVKKWKPTFLLATKIPLSNANLKLDNKSLPMQYQSSLGTVDAIAGISVTNNTWLIAAALQQPLTGHNNNNFLPVYWANPDAAKYAPGNNFNRKADVLLKANYTSKQIHQFKFNVGVLAIYHLGKDDYIDGNISNKPIEINGSEGLTVNITSAGWLNVSKRFTLGLLAGFPIAVREKRPDGLTREFSISTELIFNIR